MQDTCSSVVAEERQIGLPQQVDDVVPSGSSNNAVPVISGGSNGGNRRAWNKGVAVPESVRNKVSSSMKKRWKDPE